MYMWLYA